MSKIKSTLFFVLTTFHLFGGSAECLAQVKPRLLILGILEEHAEDNNTTNAKPIHKNYARFIFTKNPKWQALTQNKSDHSAVGTVITGIPEKANWLVCEHGKNTTNLRTESNRILANAWGYQTNAVLLNSKTTIPKSGSPSLEFKQGMDDTAVHKPLVILNRDHCLDPDDWEKFSVDQATLKILLPKFREELSKTEDGTIQPVSERLVFKNSDVKVVGTHSTKNGNKLVSLSLKPGVDKSSEQSPDIYVFALDAKKQISYLGMNRLFLDAGDYDGDGASEVLLMIAGYNHDGYELYDSGLKKLSEFSWHYH